MGIKGCWTCRERKVRCDSRRPTCGNCTKARRICQGYGIQLSWPREGDEKRAIVLQHPHRTAHDLSLHSKMFLNTSSWDTSLSQELANGMNTAYHLRTMQVPRPTYLSPILVSRGESNLLGFFNESRSLILGPTDEETLTHFILRIAFSNPSNTSNPVLQGVFALASLQLHGSLRSFRYKHFVLSLIRDSVNWLNEETLLQNLMAIMLLYHYELSLDSNSKGSWITYLCTVKRIINTSPAIHKLVRQEYSVFLDWIYYHEVLAEFTVRHWKVPYEGCGWAPEARSSNVKEAVDIIGCPVEVLELVSLVCRRAIISERAQTNHATSAIERSKLLEQNIYSAVGDYGPVRGQCGDRNAMVSNIHRLACLIYVNRTVHCVSGKEFYHRRLVREGILLLHEMGTCQNAWPLFIIACEAIDDDQRLAILDVFEKSRQDRRRRSSHVHFIQQTVEALWNQRDLNVENEVDFLTILNAVIGGVPFIPPFA